MASAPLLSARARSSTSSVIRDLLRLVDRPDMLSLAGGLPAAEFLPVERIRQAMVRVAGARALQYGPTEGMVELRTVVAHRLGAPVDGIVICTGSQQGLDLVARTLLDPGDVVVVEDPSYLGSLQSYRANGAHLHAVPGDDDGLRVDVLAERLAAGLRPKLLSVVTDFANPTGATLSLERRRALLDLSERYGFVVLEDNPYGELRWAGERLASLGELSGGSELVVTLGSASKVLSPGLRLGWMRGPAWLVDAAVKLKQSADLHTSSLDQLLAADVLGDAEFMAGHLERIRSDYRTRAHALVDALAAEVPHAVEARCPDGGMFVWARLRDGSSAADLFERAIEAGVSFVPGSAFAPDDTPSDRMRMCFTTLGAEDLGRAVRRLGTVFAPSVAAR